LLGEAGLATIKWACMMGVLNRCLAHSEYANGNIKSASLTTCRAPSRAERAGWLIAARMGAEDFGAAAKGMKIEIAGADHHNKLDIESIATRSSSQPLSCASAWPRLKRLAVAAAPGQPRLRRLFPMQLERLRTRLGFSFVTMMRFACPQQKWAA
jgi:hypothetical protein